MELWSSCNEEAPVCFSLCEKLGFHAGKKQKEGEEDMRMAVSMFVSGTGSGSGSGSVEN